MVFSPLRPRRGSTHHDEFGLLQSKFMNVIDSCNSERNAGGKALTLFLIPL
jgi:hypothetical protein